MGVMGMRSKGTIIAGVLTLLVAAIAGMSAFKSEGNQVKAQDSDLQLPVIVFEQLQLEQADRIKIKVLGGKIRC